MPRLIACTATILTLCVLTAAGLGDDAAARTAPAQLGLESFDAAWSTIKRSHYDVKMNGVDWDKVKAELRPKAAAAKTTEELRGVIRAMLDRLGESHFALIPREIAAKVEAKPTADASKPARVTPPAAPPVESGEKAKSEPTPAPAPAALRPALRGLPVAPATAASPNSKETPSSTRDTAAPPTEDAHRGDVGFDVRRIDQQLVVTSVAAQGPAARAGVRPGWVLKSVNGEPMSKLLKALAKEKVDDKMAGMMAWRAVAARLRGFPGSTVRLEFLDGDDASLKVELKRRREPGEIARFGNLPPILANLETERLQTPAGQAVGVVRFNIWLMPVAPLFDKAIDQFRDTAGIVIDLRGNPGGIGGMAMGFAGHFLDKQTSLGAMKMRNSEMKFVAMPRRVSTDGQRVQPFSGPVAILIDAGSLSTSEIFAGGLQSLGRARVFGQNTGGAALPSAMVALPNGDVLQHAIGNFVTSNGRRLEGQGVVPDETVPLTRADLLHDRDPVLQAALRWVDSGKK